MPLFLGAFFVAMCAADVLSIYRVGVVSSSAPISDKWLCSNPVSCATFSAATDSAAQFEGTTVFLPLCQPVDFALAQSVDGLGSTVVWPVALPCCGQVDFSSWRGGLWPSILGFSRLFLWF